MSKIEPPTQPEPKGTPEPAGASDAPVGVAPPISETTLRSEGSVTSGETAALNPAPAGFSPGPEFLDELRSKLDALSAAHAVLGAETKALTRQLEIMQSGMRQLGSRVSDAATSLAAPRVQGLCMRLILLHDLIAPPSTGLSGEAASVLGLMAAQIEQILRIEGLTRIEAEGAAFDMAIHKPVEIVTVEDQAQHNRVLALRQNGWHSEMTVLRPASVVIGRYASGEQPGPGVSQPCTDNNIESDNSVNKE